jgi:alpha/beta superfamily hydrolase
MMLPTACGSGTVGVATALAAARRHCRATAAAVSNAVSVVDEHLKMPDGTHIAVRVRSPRTPPRAAAVFAHGGCFARGDHTTQPDIAEALSSVGVASVSSAFRQGASHPHPAAQNDLAAVAAFAQEQWPALPLGVVGSSSGGWHALALARKLGAAKFCVALCPVADPMRRAEYLRLCVDGCAAQGGYAVAHSARTAQGMLELQLGYWRTDAAMRAAADELRAPSDVPTMLVLGGVDRNAPLQVTHDVMAWAARTLVLGGCGHEIQEGGAGAHLRSWLPDVERFVTEAVAV